MLPEPNQNRWLLQLSNHYLNQNIVILSKLIPLFVKGPKEGRKTVLMTGPESGLIQSGLIGGSRGDVTSQAEISSRACPATRLPRCYDSLFISFSSPSILQPAMFPFLGPSSVAMKPLQRRLRCPSALGFSVLCTLVMDPHNRRVN